MGFSALWIIVVSLTCTFTAMRNAFNGSLRQLLAQIYGKQTTFFIL
jgi:hypothetical protein